MSNYYWCVCRSSFDEIFIARQRGPKCDLKQLKWNDRECIIAVLPGNATKKQAKAVAIKEIKERLSMARAKYRRDLKALET